MLAIAIGWLLSASHMRFVRSSILDSLDTDSVKMARVKGLPPRLVIWKHALKNAAIPVFTLSAVNFAHLIPGAVVTETHSLQHIGFLTADLAMEIAKNRFSPTAELLEYGALDNGRHIKAS
jgi:ABC-type dipeptide/oligopeptide/nickel transport system permease component